MGKYSALGMIHLWVMKTELLKIIAEADAIIQQWQDYRNALLESYNELNHVDQQITEVEQPKLETNKS